MKHLILLLLLLSGVLVNGQSLTYKFYKNGQLVGSKVVKLPTRVVVKVVNKYIKVTKIKKVKVPVDKIQYKIVEVAVKPTALDTLSILQQYYSKNIFTDVLVLDKGQGSISITDTVSHNRLVGRTWTSSIKPRVVSEVVEVAPQPTREYFIGPEMMVSYDGRNNWYGVNLLIRNKVNSLVKLGTGMTMRDGVIGPKPFLVGGVYLKFK